VSTAVVPAIGGHQHHISWSRLRQLAVATSYRVTPVRQRLGVVAMNPIISCFVIFRLFLFRLRSFCGICSIELITYKSK